MARPAATPESEKEKRRKWILLITLLLSFAVMITSLFFLAKIRGWRVRRNDKTLLTIVNAQSPVPSDSAQTLAFCGARLRAVPMNWSRCFQTAERPGMLPVSWRLIEAKVSSASCSTP